MDFKENINEVFDIEYQEIGELGDPILEIHDKDGGRTWRFYPDDIKVIVKFLDRLKEMKVLKIDDKEPTGTISDLFGPI